ncbi:DUF3558 family protein [Haloechinothrix sp. LS1_15]|uniref:DUF3558 family protein n=1 Tax=Haloechinothrix sp. LS1_15 TaxID=2652248 RepID=UPI0029483C78|nr:DUF3558 family protein [Haloechinothrix sp. LS1_15]MDV6012299.1 DUF3558 domain-containing protein [Haloechinothrix sp. LS1_15]
MRDEHTVRSATKVVCLVPTVVLALASCGQETGTAEPDPERTPGFADGDVGEDGVLTLDPCETLDAALEGEGFDPSEPRDIRGDYACTTSKPREITVTLELMEAPFDILEPDMAQVYEGVVNGREARLFTETLEGASDGHCGISMKAQKSQSAVVFVTQVNRDTDTACENAEQIAERVEPELPPEE